MEKNSMESSESLSILEQFKFNLRTLVAKLSALKEIEKEVTPADIKLYKAQVNELDDLFEDHKPAFTDDELVEITKLLDEAEQLTDSLDAPSSPREEES